MGKVLRVWVFCVLFVVSYVRLQSSHLDNSTRHFLVTVQNAFCEAPSSCSDGEKVSGESNTTANFTLDRLTTRPPDRPSKTCCDTCSCSQDCLKTDTCCPEMLNIFPQVSTRKLCRSSQLRPYSRKYPNERHHYLMLKGCSVESDQITMDNTFRKMCESPEEYETLDTKVPVTDIKSRAVYINRYCALCNAVLEENMIYWKPEILCANDSLRPTNMAKIVTEVVGSVGCNMIYRAPKAVIEYVRKCRSYISSCNVTGLWTQYDPIVAGACATYSSWYNKKYRNVFCYICNTYDQKGPAKCEDNYKSEEVSNSNTIMVSFSAILRFRPRDTNRPFSRTKPSACRVDQIHDDYWVEWSIFQKVCRDIFCFPPRENINGECVNPFEDITGVRYRFYIKLKPERRLEPNELVSMIDDIRRFISTLRINMFLPLESQITRIFVKFKDKDISEPSSILQCTGYQKRGARSDVPEYYLIQMDVDIAVGLHVNPSSIEQTLLLDETTVHMKSNLGYDIGFHASFIIANITVVDEVKNAVYDSISNEILCEQRQDENDIESSSERTNPGNDGLPTSGIPPIYDELKNTFTEVEGNHTGTLLTKVPGNSSVGIGTSFTIKDSVNINNQTRSSNGMFTNEEVHGNDDDNKWHGSGNTRVEMLTPTNVCPLIALSEQEFQITRYRWGIHVKQFNDNISRAKYVEMSNEYGNLSVYVCKSLFQDMVKSLLFHTKPKLRAIPQAVLSLICTCLSVACSILTLVTYAIFKDLRTQPGMNNVLLIFSLICAQILFQFGIGQAQNVPDWLCETLGVLVHFSWLLTLMWMNVCSLHMFRVFRSLKQKHGDDSVAKTTFAYTAYCVSMAVIPIMINIAYSKLTDKSIGYGGKLCYISSSQLIKYLFALPVGLIVLINMFLFLAVISTISKIAKVKGNASKNRNYAKIYIKISTLTGLTWIFGFLFAFTNLDFFEYVFIILNSGLGVFIFMSFVCNKRVLVLYLQMLGSKKTKSKYTESARMSSLSTNLDQSIPPAQSTK